MTLEGSELFDWDALAPAVDHPLKVAIIEAIRWTGQALSASDLTKVIDSEESGLSHIAYHAARLVDAGTIEIVSREERPAERFYWTPVTSDSA